MFQKLQINQPAEHRILFRIQHLIEHPSVLRQHRMAAEHEIRRTFSRPGRYIQIGSQAGCTLIQNNAATIIFLADDLIAR